MTAVKSFAAQSPKSPLAPFPIERRDPRPLDVEIEILFCGVCHTDIHYARNDFGASLYPLVPGHEIIGKVSRVGKEVKKFKEGDLVGVGCIVDSCRKCRNCDKGWEQYCETGLVGTYSYYEKDGKTITQGGYSSRIVVDERYVLSIPKDLALEKTAPLLCAGITMYSPLKYWNIGKGHRVGIVGLGGLGHIGVKLAVAFGAEVTVLSTSPTKKVDALELGASHFVLTTDEERLKEASNTFDFILDTVSGPHDYNPYLQLLGSSGMIIMIGVSTAPLHLPALQMVFSRKGVAGTLIGGISETQEMLDFCAAHLITADVEVIPIQQINEAYERMIKGEVKYRFVINMASLQNT